MSRKSPETPEAVTVTLLAHPQTAAGIRHAREVRGSRPMTAEQLRDLIDAILALRDAKEHRFRAVRQAGLESRTVVLPGCTLASITVRGRMALEDCHTWPMPPVWRKHAPEWAVLVNAWVLAHGHDREAMNAWTRENWQPLVEEWARKVHCDFATLAAETAELLAYGRPPERREGKALLDPEHPDTAGLLISLCSEIGGTPDYWLHDVPETRVAWFCRSIREMGHARYAAENPKRMDPKHPKVAAHERWRRVIEELAAEPEEAQA